MIVYVLWTVTVSTYVSPFSFLWCRSNILTSIILVTEEQLCHDVADHVTIASALRVFSQKTRHNNYHHDEDILPTTPLWKQQRNNETSTILRLTALYSMLFRLICTAIATSLQSETYRALHHRVSHNIIVHRIASYTFPFVNVFE